MFFEEQDEVHVNPWFDMSQIKSQSRTSFALACMMRSKRIAFSGRRLRKTHGTRGMHLILTENKWSEAGKREGGPTYFRASRRMKRLYIIS